MINYLLKSTFSLTFIYNNNLLEHEEYFYSKFKNYVKVRTRRMQFYLRKISLHQQKILIVSVLSNSPWLPKTLKKCPK